jgi:peptidoglycan/LPS O-acetylase OafA/YrhL
MLNTATQEHRAGRERATGHSGTVRRPGFRPDVQALRAVAVTAVVLNHLWPTRLTGGYVGVDVFFVISGFLISSHLCREIVSTGRVRLGRFYARRVRRLLPAAFIVLLFCLAGAFLLLPYARWQSDAEEVLASATYWENWLLAVKSVDYSALTAAASLTQHYWSLSVEEQFYLCWPLLLLVLFKIPLRRARITGIVLVGLASLAFSVYFTMVAKSQAYFVTPTRVWEFAGGAAIALGGERFVLTRVWANLASLLGLAMILGSVVAFDQATEFPGLIAVIPAAGTCLIIVGGTRPGRQWHSVLSSSRPVQFLGNISYSLYLWHWPLIVLAPFVLRGALNAGRLTSPQRVGILAIALIVAYLSKILVEDHGMTWPRLVGSTRLTFAAMTAAMIVIAVVAGGLVADYDRHTDQAEEAARNAAIGPCHGAAALAPGGDCADPFGPATVADMGPANRYYTSPSDCPSVPTYLADTTKTTRICDFSGHAASAPVVWLIGDSHAQQWQGPLIDLARQRKWVLKLSYLGGCPTARVQFRGYDGSNSESDIQRCMNWTAMMAGVITDDHPAYVFTSFFARAETVDDNSGRPQGDQYLSGVLPYWNRWTGAGAKVFVLGDPPLNDAVRSVDCVALNPAQPRVCAADRAKAQPPDPLAYATKHSKNADVTYVDLTGYFCDARKCYGVVGNVPVYYDANHLNLEFSRSLRPMIATAMGLSGN